MEVSLCHTYIGDKSAIKAPSASVSGDIFTGGFFTDLQREQALAEKEK